MAQYDEISIKEAYDQIPTECREEYAFISLKIKHFRKFNRLYGRKCGDELIQSVLKEAQIWAKPYGIVAHIYLGYYNVLVKLPKGPKDDLTLLQWVSSLGHEIYKMKHDARFQEQIFCGFGVYLLDKEPVDFFVAQYNADMARSQSNERDFLISHMEVYGSSYIEQGLNSPDYRKMLPNALKSGHVKMYLQPKVDLATGKVVSAEALMRWIDPVAGMLPLGEFLPILEECGQMNLIDRFMLEEACKYILNWQQVYHKQIQISVNLSKNTFVYPFFMDEFREIHDKYPCQKSCIELELLESIILNQVERLKEVAAEIKAFGFMCSLDDFGSGYSSYSVLSNAPIDVLKIDRSMLMNHENQAELILNKYIIQAAHELGIQVVAEGVESKEYVKKLIAMSCDFIQGFVFYRPMSVEEFEQRFVLGNEMIDLHSL